MKRAAASDRAGQALGPASVLDRRDEQLHVPVALARTLAVDGQPPLGIIGRVLVFLSGLQGVFDRGLRPDLNGPEIDAASGAERIASEDAGQLLEADGQGPQHHRRSAAEQGTKLIGQLLIPVPASPPEANHEIASQLGGTVHALRDGSDETVASQLE